MVPLGLGLALNVTWAGSPGHLATSFEANRGQFEPDVRYAHVGGDLDVRVRSDGTLRVGVAGWQGSLVIGQLGARMESIAGTGERVARAKPLHRRQPAGLDHRCSPVRGGTA
jgi:hypothetical protein